MAKEASESGKSSKGPFWIVASIVLLMVVGYNIYSGVTLKKLDVFGLFVAEFDGSAASKAPATATPTQPAAVMPPAAAVVQPPSQTVSAPAPAPAHTTALQQRIDQLESMVRQGAGSAPAVPPQPAGFQGSLSGMWESEDGLQYQIVHNGSRVSLSELNPMFGVTASGEGQLTGHQISLNYVTALGTNGRANLTVAPEGDEIEGTFTDLTTGVTSTIYLSR